MPLANIAVNFKYLKWFEYINSLSSEWTSIICLWTKTCKEDRQNKSISRRTSNFCNATIMMLKGRLLLPISLRKNWLVNNCQRLLYHPTDLNLFTILSSNTDANQICFTNSKIISSIPSFLVKGHSQEYTWEKVGRQKN